VLARSPMLIAGSYVQKICVNNNCEIVLRPLGRDLLWRAPGGGQLCELRDEPYCFSFIIDWTLLSSMVSDLEAFSHKPTDGSFTALAFQPTVFTNYLVQRFLS